MLGEYLLCGIPLIHPLNVSLKRAQRCPLYHNIEKCMPFGVKKKMAWLWRTDVILQQDGENGLFNYGVLFLSL